MSEQEPPQEITFQVGARRAVVLSRIDANEIRGRAVPSSNTTKALHLAVTAGMQTGRVVIEGSGPPDADEVRHELVLVLEAIGEEHELRNGQAELLEVARLPLTVQNP